MALSCVLSSFFLLLSSLAPSAVAAGVTTYGQVFADARAPNGIRLVTSLAPLPNQAGVIGAGSFNDSMDFTGWGRLDVSAPAGAANETLLSYGVGFLEGALTAQRIWEMYWNNWAGYEMPAGIAQFLTTNWAYTQAEAKAHPEDPFWYHVGLLNAQLVGLFDGYSSVARANQTLPFLQFALNTLVGDMDDLRRVFAPEAREGSSDEHCSALFKVLGSDPANAPTDILAGHTTWSNFEGMTRIWKVYDLPWRMSAAAPPTVPGRVISMSSYPGCLTSDDDWMVAYPTHLVFTETTIENNNRTLWKYVVADQVVLEWTRAMLANRLARSGPEWTAWFSQHNSGTYNNMWHVLDYKLFTPGKPLPTHGLLTVLEQMPGPFVVVTDATSFLRNQSYWASYNRIFDSGLFEVTNQTALLIAYGDHFSWNLTARARIFAREEGSVTDLPSFQRLMRYNRFQTDPMGTQGCTGGSRSASNAISERGDLTAANATCIGDIAQQDEAGIDCKVTSFGLLTSGNFSVLAQSGPTYDDQPPFRFSTSPVAGNPHIGLPDLWVFPWVPMNVDVSALPDWRV